ncbi:unnamed protein product [Amoebophrya sp. A120]|nr:unnamed protein product [Amoebophrya sp. A120]|eukprot:GSA120T00022819001.1
MGQAHSGKSPTLSQPDDLVRHDGEEVGNYGTPSAAYQVGHQNSETGSMRALYFGDRGPNRSTGGSGREELEVVDPRRRNTNSLTPLPALSRRRDSSATQRRSPSPSLGVKAGGRGFSSSSAVVTQADHPKMRSYSQWDTSSLLELAKARGLMDDSSFISASGGGRAAAPGGAAGEEGDAFSSSAKRVRKSLQKKNSPSPENPLPLQAQLSPPNTSPPLLDIGTNSAEPFTSEVSGESERLWRATSQNSGVSSDNVALGTSPATAGDWERYQDKEASSTCLDQEQHRQSKRPELGEGLEAEVQYEMKHQGAGVVLDKGSASLTAATSASQLHRDARIASNASDIESRSTSTSTAAVPGQIPSSSSQNVATPLGGEKGSPSGMMDATRTLDDPHEQAPTLPSRELLLSLLHAWDRGRSSRGEVFQTSRSSSHELSASDRKRLSAFERRSRSRESSSLLADDHAVPVAVLQNLRNVQGQMGVDIGGTLAKLVLLMPGEAAGRLLFPSVIGRTGKVHHSLDVELGLEDLDGLDPEMTSSSDSLVDEEEDEQEREDVLQEERLQVLQRQRSAGGAEDVASSGTSSTVFPSPLRKQLLLVEPSTHINHPSSPEVPGMITSALGGSTVMGQERKPTGIAKQSQHTHSTSTALNAGSLHANASPPLPTSARSLPEPSMLTLPSSNSHSSSVKVNQVASLSMQQLAPPLPQPRLAAGSVYLQRHSKIPSQLRRRSFNLQHLQHQAQGQEHHLHHSAGETGSSAAHGGASASTRLGRDGSNCAPREGAPPRNEQLEDEAVLLHTTLRKDAQAQDSASASGADTTTTTTATTTAHHLDEDTEEHGPSGKGVSPPRLQRKHGRTSPGSTSATDDASAKNDRDKDHHDLAQVGPVEALPHRVLNLHASSSTHSPSSSLNNPSSLLDKNEMHQNDVRLDATSTNVAIMRKTAPAPNYDVAGAPSEDDAAARPAPGAEPVQPPCAKYVMRFLSGSTHALEEVVTALQTLAPFQKSAPRTIAVAGGGAHKYKTLFKEALNLEFEAHREMESVVEGLRFVLERRHIFKDEILTINDDGQEEPFDPDLEEMEVFEGDVDEDQAHTNNYSTTTTLVDGATTTSRARSSPPENAEPRCPMQERGLIETSAGKAKAEEGPSRPRHLRNRIKLKSGRENHKAPPRKAAATSSSSSSIDAIFADVASEAQAAAIGGTWDEDRDRRLASSTKSRRRLFQETSFSTSSTRRQDDEEEDQHNTTRDHDHEEVELDVQDDNSCEDDDIADHASSPAVGNDTEEEGESASTASMSDVEEDLPDEAAASGPLEDEGGGSNHRRRRKKLDKRSRAPATRRIQHPLWEEAFLLVNIGSGVSILHVTPSTFARVGGTGCGGGTFLGLTRLLCGTTDFSDALALASEGDAKRIDTLVSDIYGESGSAHLGLPPSLTASNFGKVGTSLPYDTTAGSPSHPDPKDLARAVLQMVTQQVAVLAVAYSQSLLVRHIFFVGGFFEKNKIAKTMMSKTMRDLRKRAFFVRHSDFLGAIGSLAYSMKFKETQGNFPAGQQGAPAAGDAQAHVKTTQQTTATKLI